jgi:diacylglycerol kinase family enzyme
MSEAESGPREAGRRDAEIVLICNPRAGGRWRELAAILDSEEARHVRRIVTDEVADIGPALSAIGRDAGLICVYGGDGTIQRVLDRLSPEQPDGLRLALIGGGTMNVTSRWCGFDGSPAENFRHVVRAYESGDLLLREVPLLEIERGDLKLRGFTFGMGPIVRVLDAFEKGPKNKRRAVGLALRAMAAAWLPRPRLGELLAEMEAEVAIDGEPLPYDRYAALFANVTGQINPGITPFVGDRTRDQFYCAAYAAESREVARALPLLARGILPIDAVSLLRQMAPWKPTREGRPTDPRYVNRLASSFSIRTSEPLFTVDGELWTSDVEQIDVRLGLRLRLAVSPAAVLAPALRRAADAIGAVPK